MNKLIHFLWPTLLLTGCAKPKDFDGTWSKHNIFDTYSTKVVRKYDSFEKKGECKFEGGSSKIELADQKQSPFFYPAYGIRVDRHYDIILFSHTNYWPTEYLGGRNKLETNFRIRWDSEAPQNVLYKAVVKGGIGRHRISKKEWMSRNKLWIKGSRTELQIDLDELSTAIESFKSCKKFNSLSTSSSI